MYFKKEGVLKMCGIAGWIDWSRDLAKENQTLKNMTDAIEHRGPDAEGNWLRGMQHSDTGD